VTVDVAAAAAYLRERIPFSPRTTVVLGSGLSHLGESVNDPVSIPFEDIPGFPPAGVAGHAGRYVAGHLGSAPVLLQAGRYHAYEGRSMELVSASVRVAAAFGVEVLVVTNAAGGIHQNVGPGDVILLDDHINLMFRSPLAGAVQSGEERFPDMSAPYDAELQDLALAGATDLGIELSRGTYAAVLGPSYETAAEVRMLRTLGADVVGMSTVPEVIVARALGLRCAGFSMVTNKGTGLGAGPIGHDDVIEIGRDAGTRLGALLESLVTRIEEVIYSVDAK
jgi:purine-nucleoside phosphorylase